MIKAILFDMDGILFDSEGTGREIFGELTAELGYEKGEERFLELLGSNYDRDRLVCRHYWGDDFPFDRIMGNLYDRRVALAQQGKIPLKTGAVECMDFLRKEKMPAAIVSGTNMGLILTYLDTVPGMRECFPVIVGGDSGMPSKPDPAPYLKAAELLGVNPGECMGVEDSVTGVKSLRSAGVTSVCITDLIPWSDVYEPNVDYRLPDLAAIPLLVKRLNKGGVLWA